MANQLVRFGSSCIYYSIAHLPQLVLKRERNRIRSNNKHDIVPRGKQYTWWFQTKSEQPIACPPPLHPSCKLSIGDLFWHKAGDQDQFWLRVLDDESGEEMWKVIERGYVREDGRRLTVTPTKQVLSWVGTMWGNRRVTESEYHISMSMTG